MIVTDRSSASPHTMLYVCLLKQTHPDRHTHPYICVAVSVGTFFIVHSLALISYTNLSLKPLALSKKPFKKVKKVV